MRFFPHLFFYIRALLLLEPALRSTHDCSLASRLLGLGVGPAGGIAEEACRLGGRRRLLLVGWLCKMGGWLQELRLVRVGAKAEGAGSSKG